MTCPAPQLAVAMDRRSVANEMDSLPMSKRRRTRTVKSEADSEPSKDETNGCKLVAVIWTPGGRECILCGISNKAQDPVWESLPGRRWGYPPVKNKNQGQVCWYCYRIWLSRYKVQLNLTLAKLPAFLGREPENKQQLKAYLEALIEVLQKDQEKAAQIPWSILYNKAELTRSRFKQD